MTLNALIVAAILMAMATSAYAYCRTHTYLYGGRMVVCTTCCYGSSCTTTCH